MHGWLSPSRGSGFKSGCIALWWWGPDLHSYPLEPLNEPWSYCHHSLKCMSGLGVCNVYVHWIGTVSCVFCVVLCWGGDSQPCTQEVGVLRQSYPVEPLSLKGLCLPMQVKNREIAYDTPWLVLWPPTSWFQFGNVIPAFLTAALPARLLHRWWVGGWRSCCNGRVNSLSSGPILVNVLIKEWPFYPLLVGVTLSGSGRMSWWKEWPFFSHFGHRWEQSHLLM